MKTVIEEDCEYVLGRATASLNNLAGASVLITGAAGFVGAFLVDVLDYANRHALAKPCEVSCYDTMVAASRMSGKRGNIWFFSPQTRPNFSGYDYVVHAASIASPKIYMKKPFATLEANVGLTEAMLKGAAMSKSMLHFSSSEVYGDPPPEMVPTPETYWGNVSFTGSRSVYDESKRYAETLCHVYHREMGVPVKVVRPSNLYGPGQNLQDGRVVPAMMRAALTGETFKVFGGGASTRSFCYIADAVVQLLAVLLDGRSGEAYNVGDPTSEMSVEDLAREFAALVPGFMWESVADDETLADAPHRRKPDIAKVMAIAKPPTTGILEGLMRTWRHYNERAVADSNG